MPSPLVSTDWLKGKLDDSTLSIVDASWFPSWVAKPDAGRAAYEKAHIPGAVYFDIDEIADKDTDLPHMMPAPAVFATAMEGLGIDNNAHVVVYDCNNFFASARVWWMFRAMGHENVSVLNGGLRAWQNEGEAVESGSPVIRTGARFMPRVRPDLVASAMQVSETIQKKRSSVLDARPAGRFAGNKPEPRQGLRSGHIPGSINVPSIMLVADDGKLPDGPSLEKVIGSYKSSPAITTCGSGVSAAIIALALAELGNWDVAIYDGSWSDWARDDANPIEVAMP